jgi:hypothetical protein
MGAIADRSHEHLGTSDKAIIAARQLLLEGTNDVEGDRSPRGLDPETSRTIRPYDAVVAHGEAWQQTFVDHLVAHW